MEEIRLMINYFDCVYDLELLSLLYSLRLARGVDLVVAVDVIVDHDCLASYCYIYLRLIIFQWSMLLLLRIRG